MTKVWRMRRENLPRQSGEMVVEAVAGGVFWWMESARCRKPEKIKNKQNYETKIMK